jgi:hypothetical protein
VLMEIFARYRMMILQSPNPDLSIYELHSKYQTTCIGFQHKEIEQRSTTPLSPSIYLAIMQRPFSATQTINPLNSKNPSSSPRANSHAGAYSPASPAPRKHNNTPSHSPSPRTRRKQAPSVEARRQRQD